MFKKILSLSVVVCFFINSLGPIPKAHADVVPVLPQPGTMVDLSPAYEPPMIKGLTVHKDNPFLFDFILDTGNDVSLRGGEADAAISLKKEGDRLVKYFFACLTIPEKDLWVNLSPYEKDKMIPQALGQTGLGSDLLAEDYILKQLTASLIYPEKNLGKEFWDRVYSKARQMYGTTQIPVNTFNKVWILADKATVYEHGQTAFVLGGHLKVMLDEDYLALSKHQRQPGDMALAVSPSTLPSEAALNVKATQRQSPNALASKIVREIVLPEIEKEVNTGKNFSTLRQIFNSLILATWYKKNLKEALLTQIYADKSTINGVIASGAKQSREEIYQQYLKAYKKGVFNYIKEEPGADGQPVPRKYFSGGFKVDGAMLTTVTSQAMISKILAKMSRIAGFLSLSVFLSCSTFEKHTDIGESFGNPREVLSINTDKQGHMTLQESRFNPLKDRIRFYLGEVRSKEELEGSGNKLMGPGQIIGEASFYDGKDWVRTGYIQVVHDRDASGQVSEDLEVGSKQGVEFYRITDKPKPASHAMVNKKVSLSGLTIGQELDPHEVQSQGHMILKAFIKVRGKGFDYDIDLYRLNHTGVAYVHPDRPEFDERESSATDLGNGDRAFLMVSLIKATLRDSEQNFASPVIALHALNEIILSSILKVRAHLKQQELKTALYKRLKKKSSLAMTASFIETWRAFLEEDHSKVSFKGSAGVRIPLEWDKFYTNNPYFAGYRKSNVNQLLDAIKKLPEKVTSRLPFMDELRNIGPDEDLLDVFIEAMQQPRQFRYIVHWHEDIVKKTTSINALYFTQEMEAILWRLSVLWDELHSTKGILLTDIPGHEFADNERIRVIYRNNGSPDILSVDGTFAGSDANGDTRSFWLRNNLGDFEMFQFGSSENASSENQILAVLPLGDQKFENGHVIESLETVPDSQLLTAEKFSSRQWSDRQRIRIYYIPKGVNTFRLKAAEGTLRFMDASEKGHGVLTLQTSADYGRPFSLDNQQFDRVVAVEILAPASAKDVGTVKSSAMKAKERGINQERLTPNAAMLNDAPIVQQRIAPGGIDLNSANMGMTVTKDANGGVKVNFDPAMMVLIRKQGVYSAEPFIISVSPMDISEIRPLLGLRA